MSEGLPFLGLAPCNSWYRTFIEIIHCKHRLDFDREGEYKREEEGRLKSSHGQRWNNNGLYYKVLTSGQGGEKGAGGRQCVTLVI